MNRCLGCWDLCGSRTLCRKCIAWHDMQTALEHVASLGIDAPRLRRALAVLLPRRRKHVTVAMFEKLRRRVEELEATT